MFLDYTYQDWINSPTPTMIRAIVDAYRGSVEFKQALDAVEYFRSRNPTVSRKIILKTEGLTLPNGKPVTSEKAIVGNRIFSNFFRRFVVQQNQFLLGNGCSIKYNDDDSVKDKLGAGFDTTLQRIGQYALIQGVCYGFYNNGIVERIKAVTDSLSGFAPLFDEYTGELMAGIRFWQLASTKPRYLRVFEVDGYTDYIDDSGTMTQTEVGKRAYVLKIQSDAFGSKVVEATNYESFPVVPFYANEELESELTPSIKSKIDLYDTISSDFGDNLERTNDVYWVINNFGGNTEQALQMLNELNRLKFTYATSNREGGSSTVEPHTIEVPYEARKTALDLLEEQLYKDYMALNMDEITGGSLTNVAIEVATANLNLKADLYEWQAFDFCQRMMRLVGVETEQISFKRRAISNSSEVIANIQAMRPDITRKKALELYPYIPSDEVEGLLKDKDAEEITGAQDLNGLNKQLQE